MGLWVVGYTFCVLVRGSVDQGVRRVWWQVPVGHSWHGWCECSSRRRGVRARSLDPGYAGRLVWTPVPRVDWRFSPVSTRLSVAAIPLTQGCIKSFLLLCTGLDLWYSHISRAMDAAAVPPAKRAGQCPFFSIGGIFPALGLLPSRTASKERLNASEQQLSPRSSSCQGQRV